MILANSILILLVDDHAIVRSGLRMLLESERGVDYQVGEASTAEEALRMYRQTRYDIVVMDLNMPGMGGLEGVRRLRAYHADARVLALSMHEDADFVARVRAAGACGYVTKRSVARELIQGVSVLLKGREYFSRDVAGSLDSATDANSSPLQALSAREFQVFSLLAEGRSVAEIATALRVSPKTVNNHRSNIMHKLEVNKTVQLTRLAVRHGLLEP